MNVPLRKPWTQDEFFAWDGHQDGRYEFDGFQPVAMTGGNINHNRIMLNVQAALRERLRGGPCEPLGPDAGVATTGANIRYPDALVTCSKQPSGEARTVLGVVVVFEVLSPTSGRTDRIVKVREYAAVDSILRYVIFESTGVGLQVFERQSASESWKALALTGDDILQLPEIGIEIPVTAFYEGVDFTGGLEADASPAR